MLASVKESTEKIYKDDYKNFYKLRVSKVVTSYCTEDKTIEMFKREYKEDFIQIWCRKNYRSIDVFGALSLHSVRITLIKHKKKGRVYRW